MLARSGTPRCMAHQQVERRESDARRGSSHERGYTSAWRRARESFLRAHPLCAEHERGGGLAAASVVDHIKPHRGDMKLFWDRSNWQGLCKPCHDVKTATQDGGFGNARG